MKENLEKADSEELKNEDFEMPIESCFQNTSAAALELVGTVAAGKVNAGDEIYINDEYGHYLTPTKVIVVIKYQKKFDKAEKGETVSLRVDLDVENWKTQIKNGFVASATKGTTSTRPATPITRE